MRLSNRGHPILKAHYTWCRRNEYAFVIINKHLVPLIILSSFNENKKYNNNFYALILLMQFGLVGVFTALDGLLFYVFWEVMLILIWFIAGLWGDEEKN